MNPPSTIKAAAGEAESRAGAPVPAPAQPKALLKGVLIYNPTAGQRDLRPVHPRLQLDAQRRIVGVLLPGERGYDELAGDGP